RDTRSVQPVQSRKLRLIYGQRKQCELWQAVVQLEPCLSAAHAADWIPDDVLTLMSQRSRRRHPSAAAALGTPTPPLRRWSRGCRARSVRFIPGAHPPETVRLYFFFAIDLR